MFHYYHESYRFVCFKIRLVLSYKTQMNSAKSTISRYKFSNSWSTFIICCRTNLVIKSLRSTFSFVDEMGFFKWAGLYIVELASLIYYGEKNSGEELDASKMYAQGSIELKEMGEKLLNSQAAEEKNSNIFFFITIGILFIIVIKCIVLACFCMKRCVKKPYATLWLSHKRFMS